MATTYTSVSGESNMSEHPIAVQTIEQEFFKLVGVTNKEKPKQEDVEKLRHFLKEHPELSEAIGNAVRVTGRGLIARRKLTDAVRLSVEAYCELQRERLGYTTATQMERMLIDHIIVCWLWLQEVESWATVTLDRTMAQANYWERIYNEAQRRYLRAIESLARVRKVMERSPSLQVNIANQQIVNS
jgi:hypothetical protein